MNNGKIGLFDSGFGGLAIMRAVVARLPLHDYIYLGDSKHVPYGNRSQDEIYELTKRAVAYLFNSGCDLVILACNTASSQALRRVQQEFLPAYAPNKRVLGVIIPAAELAVQATKTNRVGVMATEVTVNSGAFVAELQKLKPAVGVYQQACPLLVPLIESGRHHSPATETILHTYMAPLLQAGVDTLILGCTHYELIKSSVERIAGRQAKIISEGPIVAERLADYLARHPELEQHMGKHGERTFYYTKSGQKAFELLATEFFGSPIRASQVTL